MIAVINTVFTLDEKSRMRMWKIKCLGMFAVPPPLFWSSCKGTSVAQLEGEAKKIHKRPTSNHKLIYICQPITNL